VATTNATQRVAMRLDERRRPVERVVEVVRADQRVAAAALFARHWLHLICPRRRSARTTRTPDAEQFTHRIGD
jgi:hypothetical protein